MIGTPAVSLPSVVPGIPTSIPEIALVKKNDQRGVAKIGVFAYNRVTGRAVWQSGAVESSSQSKDMWVFGAGPYTRGTIRQGAELAGEPVPDLANPAELFAHKSPKEQSSGGTGKEQFFPGNEAPGPQPVIPAALMGVTGGAILADRQVVR